VGCNADHKLLGILAGYAFGMGSNLDELRLCATRCCKDLAKYAAGVSKLPNAEVFATKVLHLEGEEVFGSTKCKLSLPRGCEGNSHTYNKANFSHP
jgi:hypothetical protein